MEFENAAFRINGKRKDELFGCYDAKLVTLRGMWEVKQKDENGNMGFSLLLLFLQITITVVLHRLLEKLLRRLHLPQIIPLILSGLVLSPTLLGRWDEFRKQVYPLYSVQLLETVGLVSLMYYFFALGVTMDMNVIENNAARNKGICLFLANSIISIFIASITYFTFRNGNDEKILVAQNILVGIAYSMTGFATLNSILVKLRLFNTDIGRIIRSCSIMESIFAWIILPIAINLKKKPKVDDFVAANKSIFDKMPGLWIPLLNIGFIIFCFFIIRPLIKFFIRKTPDGQSFKESYLIVMLVGILVSGVITDYIGSHVVLGPFLMGLVMPNGPLGSALIGKVDFGNGIMLPLYFVIVGIRTWLDKPFTETYTSAHKGFVCFIVWVSFAKLFTTLLVSQFYKMTFLEGIILGLLVNAKGLLQILIVNAGFDQEILEDESFAFAVCLTVLITTIIVPTIHAIYIPPRHFIAYRRRTIQTMKGEPELRILSCIHNPRNVLSIINLLHTCQPTKKSPFAVFSNHLIELNNHDHTIRSTSTSDRTQPQADQIINAFENYQKSSTTGTVTIGTLSTISPYSSMHEEICEIAEEKGIAFIILPFHKLQTIDGGMEETNPFFRDINNNILNNSPCSVGILVDRGLSGISCGLGTSDANDDGKTSHHVAVLFFGGPDDREALSFASKMIDRRNVSVTVIRFIPTDDASKFKENLSSDMGVLKLIIDNERENQKDDNFIHQFRQKTSNNHSVMYTEKFVNDAEETVSVIKSVDNIHDLFIVGRGRGVLNTLTASMIDWSECPELGAIGDLLASPDFRTTTSVLIMQQFLGIGGAGSGDGTETPTSQYSEIYDNFHNVNQLSSPHSSEGLSQRRITRFSTDWH